MKSKKGFTLIELLAVIVILAIIALIATPIIIGVIDNARKKAFENTAYGVLEGLRLNYTERIMTGTTSEEQNFTFPNSGLKLSGEEPAYGEAKIDAKGNISFALADKDKRWCAKKDGASEKVTMEDYTEENCNLAEQITDASCFDTNVIHELEFIGFNLNKCKEMYTGNDEMSEEEVEYECYNMENNFVLTRYTVDNGYYPEEDWTNYIELYKSFGIFEDVKVLQEEYIAITNYKCGGTYLESGGYTMGSDMNPIIPEEINGHRVIAVLDAFSGFNETGYPDFTKTPVVNSITLPKSLKYFSNNNFYNEIDKLVIPENVKYIRSLSSRGSGKGLKEVVNKTGRKFDWYGIFDIYNYGTGESIFETGNVTDNNGIIVKITK